MAELRIRNVDDQLVAMLRARAEREGVSLSQAVRAVLESEAMRPRRDLLTRIDAWHGELRRRHGILPDSTPGIRAERDARG